MNIFEYLLSAPTDAVVSFPRTVDAAAAGGLQADSVGRAFGAGYQAALRALVPSIDSSVASMCVTESGGGHPRAIQTTLSDGLLNGHKTFVTMGPDAEILLVIAKTGVSASGQNILRAARVPSTAPGVNVTARPPLPIVPELPHGEVSLTNVRISDDDVLDGDGYVQYVKPFRTIEDIHVYAAVIGWLVRVGRTSWPQPTIERLLAHLATLRALGELDPLSPATHIVLGGALAEMNEAIAAADDLWQTVEPDLAAMWQRDRALMQVAQRARTARLESAWSAFATLA